jgi:hypothetical protein
MGRIMRRRVEEEEGRRGRERGMQQCVAQVRLRRAQVVEWCRQLLSIPYTTSLPHRRCDHDVVVGHFRAAAKVMGRYQGEVRHSIAR